MWEVEQKFLVPDPSEVEAQLLAMGAIAGAIQRHADTYYAHPCRDFAATGEAFRLRRIDGVAHVTYKGAKLPGSIKARRELEWCLEEPGNHRAKSADSASADSAAANSAAWGDPGGKKTAELLTLLGFIEVATVSKVRRPFRLEAFETAFEITLDDCQNVGNYAEIERVVTDVDAVEAARADIGRLAEQLSLGTPESRSYLTMLLDHRGMLVGNRNRGR
ncbi:MAG: class IV adenylate cyclase [Planctomycetota bacterium]